MKTTRSHDHMEPISFV